MKLKMLFVVSAVFLIVSGCSRYSVKDDLINYVNQELPKVTENEHLAIEEYGAVSGSNYQNDGIMYDALIITVIPRYKEFMEALEKIQPETEEVRKVHELYLDAAKEQYLGFTGIKNAIEKQDAELIKEANRHLETGQEGIKSFIRELNMLAEKHSVDF